MSEYNCRFYAEICCCDFDANEYLLSLGNEIRDNLKEEGYVTSHLRLFARGDDEDYCEAELQGADEEVMLTHEMADRRTDLPVEINTAASAECSDLTGIINRTVIDVSGRFNLSVVMY